MVRMIVALALSVMILVPAQSQAEPPPVEDYGKLPAMDEVQLSASGARYVFIADDGQARRLFVATIDNKPLHVLNLGNAKVRSVRWAGEDFVLFVTSTTVNTGPQFVVGKQELLSAFAINLRTHKLMQVFANHTNVDHAIIGSYGTALVDGRWYGYFGGFTLETGKDGEARRTNMEESGAYSWLVADLYRVDLETGDLVKVATGTNHNQDWLVGPKGEVVARSFYNEKTGEWRIMKGAFGGIQLAAGLDKSGPPRLLGLSRTGDAVLITHDTGAEESVEELPLAGGPAKPLDSLKAGEHPILDARSRLWIGNDYEDDETTQFLFPPFLKRACVARERPSPTIAFA